MGLKMGLKIKTFTLIKSVKNYQVGPLQVLFQREIQRSFRFCCQTWPESVIIHRFGRSKFWFCPQNLKKRPKMFLDPIGSKNVYVLFRRSFSTRTHPGRSKAIVARYCFVRTFLDPNGSKIWTTDIEVSHDPGRRVKNNFRLVSGP